MDAQELKIIYDKYYVRIYCFTRRIIKDNQMAKDITQDVFVKAWQLDSVNSNITRWLMKVALHDCIHYLRKKKNRLFVDTSEFEIPYLDDKIAVWMESAVLDSVMEKMLLLPKQRQEIMLLLFLGYNPREISQILLVPYQFVLNQKTKAINKLKILLHV